MNLELENSYFVSCLSYLYRVYSEYSVLLREKGKKKKIQYLTTACFFFVSVHISSSTYIITVGLVYIAGLILRLKLLRLIFFAASSNLYFYHYVLTTHCRQTRSKSCQRRFPPVLRKGNLFFSSPTRTCNNNNHVNKVRTPPLGHKLIIPPSIPN